MKFVRDLMSVGVPTCKTTTPVVDIARFLLEHNVEGMCVLDEEGHGVGLVSAEELVAVYVKENLPELTAEDIMREDMPTLQAEMPLELAAQFMRDQHTRIAYMTHNSAGIIYPAAFITYKHILRHMSARDANEVKDLGLEAARKSPLEQFIERRDEARRKSINK